MKSVKERQGKAIKTVPVGIQATGGAPWIRRGCPVSNLSPQAKGHLLQGLHPLNPRGGSLDQSWSPWLTAWRRMCSALPRCRWTEPLNRHSRRFACAEAPSRHWRRLREQRALRSRAAATPQLPPSSRAVGRFTPPRTRQTCPSPCWDLRAWSNEQQE